MLDWYDYELIDDSCRVVVLVVVVLVQYLCSTVLTQRGFVAQSVAEHRCRREAWTGVHGAHLVAASGT